MRLVQPVSNFLSSTNYFLPPFFSSSISPSPATSPSCLLSQPRLCILTKIQMTASKNSFVFFWWPGLGPVVRLLVLVVINFCDGVTFISKPESSVRRPFSRIQLQVMLKDGVNYTSRQRLKVITTHPPVNKTDDAAVRNVPTLLVRRQPGNVSLLVCPVESNLAHLYHILIETHKWEAGV